MEKLCILLLLLLTLFRAPVLAITAGTQDESQQWGYVQVRPKAHMFWWHYRSPYRVEDASNPWPIVLWLQGGPGASGVGIGNFVEVGPLDTDLKPRNTTWLHKADLLFVDNPVGTGYSYVEDEKVLVKTDEEAATDLTTLLKKLFNKDDNLQKSPLYIVGESYGGKYAVTLGLSALKAIEAGQLKLKLGGVALGNSWISSVDFVFAWGPLLKDLSRLDRNGALKSDRLAQKIKKQLEDGQYKNATHSWGQLQILINQNSNFVNFYNFLLDSESGSASKTAVDLDNLMNGPIKKQLKIISQNVTWGGQLDIVLYAFKGDFMKPRIKEVDELLTKGVNVTVYNGQLDIICATKGTEAWVEKLRWEGLKSFLDLNRTPLYCGDATKITRGFSKSYKNFNFYWILNAGHMVDTALSSSTVELPCGKIDIGIIEA